MRALRERRERERRDGGRQKTILRRKKTPTESVINKWREHKVVIQGRRKKNGETERRPLVEGQCCGPNHVFSEYSARCNVILFIQHHENVMERHTCGCSLANSFIHSRLCY